MTRETKIGLLVGLAFIIVIGILLSDHLTSTNEPQQAQLTQAGGNARSAVTVPGAGTTPMASNAPATPQHVTPQQPVPTREEVTPKQPPVEIVQIGGATAGNAQQQQPKQSSNTQIAQAGSTEPQTLAAQQGVTGVDSNSPPIARPADPRVPGSLANVAETMGEELVPAGQQPSSRSEPLAAKPAGKSYKAEPGDNLSRIATKTLGSASKANCNAIIAANPSLGQNPNLIVAGRSYVIPSGAAAAPVTPPTPSAPVASRPTPSSASTPEYFYTVKPGDTLTRIAVTQLGTPGAVEAIKDLNKETLKGGDVIHPNMKLRLPSKPLASAS